MLCELAEAWETSRKEREVEGYVLRGGLCQTIWGNTWGCTGRTLGQEELWGVSQRSEALQGRDAGMEWKMRLEVWSLGFKLEI